MKHLAALLTIGLLFMVPATTYAQSDGNTIEQVGDFLYSQDDDAAATDVIPMAKTANGSNSYLHQSEVYQALTEHCGHWAYAHNRTHINKVVSDSCQPDVKLTDKLWTGTAVLMYQVYDMNFGPVHIPDRTKVGFPPLYESLFWQVLIRKTVNGVVKVSRVRGSFYRHRDTFLEG